MRTPGRRGGGFLLGGLFEHLAEQFVATAQELFFQVAEVLVGGAGRGLELAGQTAQHGLALRGQEVFQVVANVPNCRGRWRNYLRPILPVSVPDQKLICAHPP